MAERILTLYLDNANGFRIRNLYADSLTNPGSVNTATVQARVTDLDGVDIPLTNGAWPLDLAYVPGSQGDYEAFIPAGDMVLDQQQNYHVVFQFQDQSIGDSGPIRYLAVVKRLYR